MTMEEREMTAYHEAGHAVALYMIHPTDDVFKATLKSRGSALGLVAHNPREELHTHNREKLVADIVVALAGYAAEKIKYGTTSTGVSSDFQKAMSIANAMVWNFGMSTKGFIGDFSVIPKDSMSSKLKEELNLQTMDILNNCLKDVNECLTQNWVVVDDMAKQLLEKEELDYKDIDDIFKKYGKNKVVSVKETDEKDHDKPVLQQENDKEKEDKDDK
jgi:cell division protease FtsH